MTRHIDLYEEESCTGLPDFGISISSCRPYYSGNAFALTDPVKPPPDHLLGRFSGPIQTFKEFLGNILGLISTLLLSGLHVVQVRSYLSGKRVFTKFFNNLAFAS